MRCPRSLTPVQGSGWQNLTLALAYDGRYSCPNCYFTQHPWEVGGWWIWGPPGGMGLFVCQEWQMGVCVMGWVADWVT